MVANDRLKLLERIVAHPDILVGFSDAGAHLRNMAHYSFPLLKLIYAEKRGQPFMSIEWAVHRLTGEIADWFNLDVGHLKIGARADIVIVEPDCLDERLDAIDEVDMPGFDGLKRLVRRSVGTVPLVMINGRVAAGEWRTERNTRSMSRLWCRDAGQIIMGRRRRRIIRTYQFSFEICPKSA